MACLDCSRYPLCVNYPDGTWRTVYDESQEEIARKLKSAKDMDMDAIIERANELVTKSLSEKEKQQEEKQDAPAIAAQQEMKTRKPMVDIPKPRASAQIKKPCTGC